MLNVQGDFYPIYKASKHDFSKETFQCAEDTVKELISRETSSDHPGMLLGKVQSGKTRTFVSILALAFDNGFDLAIVLSKNSKALIEQTTKRLREEFAPFVKDGEMDVYDIMSAPRKYTKDELESKIIFVAKKQDDNLKRLIALFKDHEVMRKMRVLVIDDEADNASIGYTKKAGLVAANKIAAQISELRKVSNRPAFLQVTATPYSLYLQPTDVTVANTTEFRPTRPAFTKLVPVPNTYVGGHVYFGESAKSETDTLESLIHHTVDQQEFDRLKKEDKRVFKISEVLTSAKIEGYRRALIAFLVGGIIQRINGIAAGKRPRTLRYTFLLHSEAARGSHEWQERITQELIAALTAAGAARDPIFSSLVGAAYDDLAKSLRLDKLPVPPRGEVESGVLEGLQNEYVTITKVNSDEDVAAMLDDSGQLKLRSTLNVFIGGQVLDRGVTLLNLIGFYYGRRPNKFQQDTVLQHSRMYGYRRNDLAVTRFHTSRYIRHAMAQMEEFDASLRSAIESGGDGAVQFIRKAQDGKIVPCSPNKILVATTQTLRPNKRILPIGFQSGYRTGANAIGEKIIAIDKNVEAVCGFNAKSPKLVDLRVGLEFLDAIKETLVIPGDEDAPPFDWDAAKAALIHLSNQTSDKTLKGKVLLWAAKDRNSARLAAETSHATYIETPDSEKTEGVMAKAHAIETPILFLLRQNGAEEKGWRGTPFYWPVVRAQARTPTAIYTAETIE